MTQIATLVNFCGLVVSETRLGTTRDKMLDPLGSVIGEYNDSQTVTGRTEYWPYGEIASETGTLLPSPLKFVGGLGYFRDRIATFLTYIRARWYYPWSTQWTTVDPLWPNEPAYGYALNHPTAYVDSLGLQPKTCRQMMNNAKRIACQVFGTKKGRDCVINCIKDCWGDTDLKRFNCLRQWCAGSNNITVLPANDPSCCVPNPPCGVTNAGTGSGCSIGICQSSCVGNSPCNSLGERRDTVLHEALHCCETAAELHVDTEGRTDCTSRCIRRCK